MVPGPISITPSHREGEMLQEWKEAAAKIISIA